MADDEYHAMICVEAANASCFLSGGAVTVAPGGTWQAQQVLLVEPL